MTYTNGSVVVQVQVSGGTPATVQLLRNDTLWQEIAPPYRYVWDTIAALDADYALTARAAIGTEIVTSPVVTVTVDHTPPTATVTPTPGNMAVDATDPIAVTFSEPILPSTITVSSVQLAVGATAVAATVALAADARSLTVALTNRSALTLPAQFKATLATTITDRAGNRLAPPASAWTWTVPAWLKLPALLTQLPPRLAIGADRRPVVQYVTLDTVAGNDVNDVRVARFENGQWNTSMGTPTTVGATAANGYSLALDSKGQPVVAWTEQFSESDVHVAVWTGTGWTAFLPALNAIVGVGKDGSLPSLRLDAMDRPVVAWREVTGVAPTYDIFTARWSGTNWMSLDGTGVSGGAGFTQLLDGPQLALDSQDAPIFGWLSGGGIGSGISLWTGSDWNRSQALVGGFTPYPVVDGTGTPLIAAKSTDLHLLKWNSAMANWTELGPPPLTTSPSWNAPRLALAPDGSPVVAWVDTSSGVRLGVARWTGGAWDTRFGVFNAGQNPLTTIVPELVVDTRGSIWVAWMEGTAVQVWMSNY